MQKETDYKQYILGVSNTDSDTDRNISYCIDCKHFRPFDTARNLVCDGCRNMYPMQDDNFNILPCLFENSEPYMSDDIEDEEQIKSQKLKRDAGKLRLTLVPTKILKAIAEIREYGCKKYSSPDNWRYVSKERYRDAAYRHFLAYIENPDGLDKESGLPTLWHLACNICFLCELEEYEKEEDWE